MIQRYSVYVLLLAVAVSLSSCRRAVEKARRNIRFEGIERVERQGLTGATVTLKLKYSYGSGRSAQRRLPHPTDDENIFVAVALELLDNIWQEGMHVRLAGIGMSDFDHQGGIQTDLFCEVDDRGAQSSDRRDLSVAIDAVRDKFGDTALSFGRQSRFND